METNDTNEVLTIYELGFLLAPTIAEENIATEVEVIKSLITKIGGAFISEDFPKLQSLAYSMPKVVAGQKYNFDDAYFGWIKFEVESSKIDEIKKELDKNDKIVRFLITTTVRENTIYSQKVLYRPISPEATPKAEGEGEPVKSPLSEEELDKTIENLVVE